MRRIRVLSIIMAGGKGERLSPLTNARSKPAVPFAGKHRIADFVLSNFINSGILSIYVLVQYRSQSLIEHIRSTWRWRMGGLRETFLTVVPPQMREEAVWYQGTADAVYQNLNLIQDFRPDFVAIFGADHIYRMDLNQMLAFHMEREAEVSVAALPVPLAEASSFGVIEVDPQQRIIGFDEKPARPRPMPNDPDRAYASMGNYLFNTDRLENALLKDAGRTTEHDFGKTILPDLFLDQQVFAYNFLENRIPGLQTGENRGYWRDVGTLQAYWAAHMDLLGERPVFDLGNVEWPIFGTIYDGPPARFIEADIHDCLIGEGCRIAGARLTRSVLGNGVTIGRGAEIRESVIMDHVGIGAGAKLQGVIVDRFNTIPAGTYIGLGRSADEAAYFRDASGLFVLERGKTRAG